MANHAKVPQPGDRAFQGDMTPMRPDEATVDPLAQELGETPAQVAPPATDRTVADGELPPAERHAHGIEDNVRHVSGIGRR
jgi:hypothetical protein